MTDLHPKAPEACIKELKCSIKFKMEEFKDTLTVSNGQCWHALFKEVVIARGFPIPRRPKTNTGLEIPLNMLAALTRTRYVDTFHSKIFIKGFSSMLVPTSRYEDIVVWHLIHSKSAADRISYLDCSVEHLDVQIAGLERSRHVVGWCSEAECIAGTSTSYCSKAPYTIDRLVCNGGFAFLSAVFLFDEY